MTRYYRRSVSAWVWPVVIALALAAALVFAHRAALERARVEERQRVLVEGERLMQQALTYSRVLARQVDSLQEVARGRDTVWLRAKATAAAVVAAPMPTDSTSLHAALHTCRSTLDATVTACDSAQAAQRAVIVAQQQRAAADSSALARQTLITAGITASRDAAVAQLASRSRWRTLERGACAASVGFNLLTVLAK